MYQLTIGGVKLPKLYVCSNDADVDTCRSNGIPYLIWKKDPDSLIKLVMYPTLKKMFPYINWENQLGIKECDVDNGIVYNPENYNYYSGSDDGVCNTALDSYVGDLSNKVNIEILNDLRLLPKFLGDIVDNIKDNYDQYLWAEGWNKKLGAAVGNYAPTTDADNLIIIDVSSSIPFGIAATLLSLADTMRNQAKANLIVTGSRSEYFEFGEELPSPEVLRRRIGRSNEGVMFAKIIEEHIYGKHIGNVICFGDEDAPDAWWNDHEAMSKLSFESVQVDAIWGYHTRQKKLPGYALWAKKVNPYADINLDTSWCDCIKSY